ncbi:TPA: transcriptional regulator [Escherichia coli]|nr:transcriptional regulator [Escherichia coli]
MSDSGLFLSKKCGCSLSPGKMPEGQFWLLIEISSVHSEKVINALGDFFVLGYTRREVCERHGVSQSYFSGALRHFRYTHQVVSKLVPFYISEETGTDISQPEQIA